MESLGLFVGHLIGDYIVQNDWMAKNKTNPHPGFGIAKSVPTEGGWYVEAPAEWLEAKRLWVHGNNACFIHCVLYTLAVWACSFWWMPYWGLAVVFLTHYPIDRYRLAYRWMQYSGQKHFSSKEHLMFPWSIVAVDNTFHLATLFVIGMIYFVL